MSIYNCAIIGYGYMGKIRHSVINQISELNLKLIIDKNIKIIPNSNEYKVFNKYQIIDFKNIDIVFVCTPNNISPKIVKNLLKSNKYIFCEKPPARKLSEVINIKKIKNSNKNLMFGFNHRFHPAIEMAKKIIDNKKYGKVISIRGVYGKSGGINFKNSWRNNKKISGGGILLDQGIHMIDIFRFFCGNFEKIKCFKSNSFWKFDIEDNAFLILKNNKNQLASLHSSSTLWRHTFRIDVALEKGYFLVEGLLSKTGSYGQEKITYAPRQFENTSKALGNPTETVIYYDTDNSWKSEVITFLKFIKNKSLIKINNIDDAYKAMKIVELAYKQK
jgi:predicted dehydrogenase